MQDYTLELIVGIPYNFCCMSHTVSTGSCSLQHDCLSTFLSLLLFL